MTTRAEFLEWIEEEFQRIEDEVRSWNEYCEERAGREACSWLKLI